MQSTLKKILKNLNSILVVIFTNIGNINFLIKRNIFISLVRIYFKKYKNIKLKTDLNSNLNNSHGIIISAFKESKKITNICLTFSENILNNSITIKRTKHCLDLWFPLIIHAAFNQNKEFFFLIDSSDEGHADYLNMDSEFKDKLIPDLYSMIINNEIDNNFIPLEFEKFKQLWLKKKNIIYWRGSSTGNYYSNFKDLQSLRRIQICKRYNNINGFDIKISRIVQNRISKKYVKDWLISNNIYSEEIGEEEFQEYKYYPDIPGNSLAWGTIRKYLMGNLIFKSYTQRKLFYYQFMQPWEDYIPLDQNFLDLKEKYEWAEKNPEEAAYIAWSGYIKAHDYINRIPEYFVSVLLKNTHKGSNLYSR